MPEMKSDAVAKQYSFTAPAGPAAANPLKQYFRRPSVHLRLPSGSSYYSPTVVQYPPTGELPVYPMTAIDEITAKTPDAAFNGSAVADIILSCVPAILDPWSITTVDLDAILVAIRMASVGQSMEIISTCPKCDATDDYDVDLGQVLQSLTPGDYNKPMVIAQLEIKLKPLAYNMINDIAKQQYELQRAMQNVTELDDETKKIEQQRQILAQLNQLNLSILLSSIEYIRTPETTVTDREYIAEFLQNCQKSDYDAITEHSIALRKHSQIQPLHIKCDECEHEYDQNYTVNPSDFFE